MEAKQQEHITSTVRQSLLTTHSAVDLTNSPSCVSKLSVINTSNQKTDDIDIDNCDSKNKTIALGKDSDDDDQCEITIRKKRSLSDMTPQTTIDEHVNKSDEGHKLNILLVDDSFAILKVVGKMLRKHGHRVTEALNGEKALSELEKARNNRDIKPFDVVIIDLHMPVMDGKFMSNK